MATIVQVPASTAVTVLPDMLQVEGVALLKVTARPKVAVALAVTVPPAVKLPGVKLRAFMLWGIKVPLPVRAARLQTVLLMTATRLPLRLPVAVGVMDTLALQLAPAAKLKPQVVVRE